MKSYTFEQRRMKQNERQKDYYYRQKMKKLELAEKLAEIKFKELKGEQEDADVTIELE